MEPDTSAHPDRSDREAHYGLANLSNHERVSAGGGVVANGFGG